MSSDLLVPDSFHVSHSRIVLQKKFRGNKLVIPSDEEEEEEDAFPEVKRGRKKREVKKKEKKKVVVEEEREEEDGNMPSLQVSFRTSRFIVR